jgi:hypothetical protein
MAILKALKPFRDRWAGKSRVKHELFTIDDEDEAQRLIHEGYAVLGKQDEEPAGTPAPEEER